MNRLNFFLVGFAHCGSSVLYEALSQHPNLVLPSSEDSEYFWFNKAPFHLCSEGGIEEWKNIIGTEAYEKEFQNAAAGAICGTSVAWSLYSAKALEAIKEANPAAKIILMLCPPVTWMRAWHHHLLRDAHEDQVDFGEALSLESERVEGKSLPRQNSFAKSLCYREAARFSEQVSAYFEAFGRENVFVGLQEDCEKNPTEFMQQIFYFLGVEPGVKIEVKETKEPEILKGTHHFDLMMKRVAGRLPGGEKWKQIFAKSVQPKYREVADKIFAPMSNQSINSILEEELLEEFEPEVAKLGELLGRDLSHWNEPRFPRSDEDDHHHHHH